jgi:tRNA(Ile)-lysidine synthase
MERSLQLCVPDRNRKMAPPALSFYNVLMRLKRHKTVQAVAGTIRRWGLIPDGSRVVVAASGGADSTALAAMLRELAGPVRRFEIVLAHYNHGLRRTAGRDERFVVALAHRWEVPLVVERGDVRRAAKERGQSLEEAAREMRYEFLGRAAAEAGAALVATGHHSDDQAETVLMNFLRGSGLRGLAGMPIRRPLRTCGFGKKHGSASRTVAPGDRSGVTLIRPLLEVDRAALVDYLRVREIKWVEDETNRSTAMQRNRVRHKLLPLLEREYAPGLRRRLASAAEQLATVQELLAGRAAAAWDGAVASAGAGAVEFRADALQHEGRAVTGELFLAALERLGAGRQDVTAAHLAAGWELVENPAGGRTVEFPGGVKLRRRGGRICLERS